MSNRVTHGACGRSWEQRGNRSGHCGADCHETYYGITAFDKHQRDGRCVVPVEGEGGWWRDTDGQWHHGKRLTEEQKRAIWG